MNFGRSPDGTEFVLRAFPFGGYAPRIRLHVLLLWWFTVVLLGSFAKVRFEDAKTVKLEDGRMVRFLARNLHKWLQAPRFTASGFCGTPSFVGSCRCSGLGFRVEGRRVTVIKVREFGV